MVELRNKKMVEKKLGRSVRIQAYFQICLMILSTFAFSYSIGELNGANGVQSGPDENSSSNILGFIGKYLEIIKGPIVGSVSAQASVLPQYNVCCEKTIGGAWCQNTLPENCDPGLRQTPTSCEATSFCQRGCCYDSTEGLCSPNTPEKVCQEGGGIWDENAECNIPQCNLGCCILGEQANFATLTRCKRLSSLYGLEIDFRSDIQDEQSCIDLAQSQDVGACVFENEFFERTCRFTTRGDCVGTFTGEFHKDRLCTDETLGTICAKTKLTTCIDGKEEVYFQDSCGNPGNIYDASKVDDALYWGNVISKEDSCTGGSNDKNCGNCEYFTGSICSDSTGLTRPTYGDFICKDLNCVDETGKEWRHGESWCEYDGNIGEGRDPVGSRHLKKLCSNGEIRNEVCSDYRNEYCLENTIDVKGGEFTEAACIANRWRDCIDQLEEKDCLDVQDRDCYWIEGKDWRLAPQSTQSDGAVVKSTLSSGDAFTGGTTPVFGTNLPAPPKKADGVCLPEVPPGTRFWSQQEVSSYCGLASKTCIYKKTDSLTGSSESGEECLTEEWLDDRNLVCSSLGDCGAYVNYINKYTYEGAERREEGRKAIELTSDNRFGAVLLSSALERGGVRERRQPTPSLKNPLEKLFNDIGLSTGVGIVLSQLAGQVTIPPAGIGASGGASEPVSPGLKILAEAYNSYVLGANPSSLAVGSTATTTVGSTATTTPGVVPPAGGSAGMNFIGWLFKGVGNLFAKGLNAVGIKTASSSTAALGPNVLFGNLIAAGIMAGVGYVIGKNIGLGGNAASAMAASFGVGTFVGSTMYNMLGVGTVASFGIGIAVAAAIFIFTYKDVETKVIQFSCKPWEAPWGGEDCKLCNEGDLECSEYRCKALGKACELENVGSGSEKCVWKDPRDVTTPGIRPLNNKEKKIPTLDHEYKDVRIRPPGDGSEPGRMRVVSTETSDGCLKAFTPLEFGIQTFNERNELEPTQCKIDFVHTNSFNNMSYDMGGNNLLKEEHIEKLVLPGQEFIDAIQLENDGVMSLFVRCADANGNMNVDEFEINFCVQAGADTTPPKVEGYNIPSGNPVQFETTSLSLDVYVNEPADCRWSRTDTTFNNMENGMACFNNPWELNANLVYTCQGNLTGIQNRATNEYHIRCQDLPDAEEADRNSNIQSYDYVVLGTQPLNILDAQPNGITISGSTNVIPVFLDVKTDNGFDNGESICSYSITGEEKDFLEFVENEGTDHKQRQDLPPGNYKYYLKCVDLGGNADYTEIEFEVESDLVAPIVVRAYKEKDSLKIITNENSECSYSNLDCNFNVEDGIKFSGSKSHTTDWKDNTYYIRCKDKFNNQPNPNSCSIIVKPWDLIDQAD